MKRVKTTDELARTPISHVPRKILIRILTKEQKVSRKSRKRFRHDIAKVVQIELAEPKNEQETYCRKLKECTMLQLHRRLVQAARRFTFAEKLLKTATDKNRRAIENECARQSYRVGWVKQEAESRIKPVNPAAKAPPFAISAENIEAAKAFLAAQK